MAIHNQKRMTDGTLTFRSTDGYIIEAPVEGFSVAVESDYDDFQTDYLLDSQFIYKTAESVTFTATLKYGENYTIRDVGTDIERTLTVKGNVDDHKSRSALGVPADAKARYNAGKETTKFTWSERVVLEEPLQNTTAEFDDSHIGIDYYE